MNYFPWIAGGAALGLAARRGRRAPVPRVDLDRIIKETYQKNTAPTLAQIIGEWPNRIERAFSSAFPKWKLDVVMEHREEFYGGGNHEEWLSITMALRPASQHPDIEWMSRLEPKEGRAMDKWFKQEFGLYPSFWDGAMDMQRRDPGFPAYNGHPININLVRA